MAKFDSVEEYQKWLKAKEKTKAKPAATTKKTATK